jgi:predicted PurR-regulated permease PerM
MMIRPDPYSDRWDYANESNQQAFINYDNGLQKMIISVGLEGENSNGVVWLFPIPSEPNKVAIDVVKSLPQLSGEEISKKAKSNLNYTRKFLQMTQLYTIPFLLFFIQFLSYYFTKHLENLERVLRILWARRKD